MTHVPPQLADRRVLVTGATGFLGGHLAAGLAGAVDLHVSSRSVPSAPVAGQWHRADLSDPVQTDALFAAVRPQIVVHLAGLSSAAGNLDQARATVRDNLVATMNVLVAATTAGVERVVVPGSLDEPSTVDEPPSSAYAVARQAVSQSVRLFHAVHGLSVVTARVFMAYGHGMAPHKLVPSVIERLLAGEAPAVNAGGRTLDWVHVDDVTDGLLAVAAAAGTEGETIDLGVGELASVSQVAELLCEVSGTGLRPVEGSGPQRSLAPAGRTADLARTMAQIGWAPRIGLREGLAATWSRAAAERQRVSV